MYLSDIYTVAVNLAGLPAISLPCAVTGEGLPIGLQLLGQRFRDAAVLEAGAAYEALRGDWKVLRADVKDASVCGKEAL